MTQRAFSAGNEAVLSKAADGELSELPAGLFQPGDVLDVDVNILYQGQYILYRPRKHKWKLDDAQKLVEFGVNSIFVKFQNVQKMKEYLDQRVGKVLDSSSVTVEEKAKVLYSTSVSAVNAVLTDPEAPETVQRSVSFVRHCVGYLGKDPRSFYQLFNNAATNFSEQTHAVHSAAYTIALAKELGYKSNNECLAVGIGALLHDIGKSRVDRKILEKSTPLTEKERQEIRMHPTLGYELVKKHSVIIPDVSELIILQHHERRNGSGYPNHLTKGIHVFSEIVGLVDVFDALTSDRVYGVKMTPLDAIRFIMNDLRDEFDQSMVACFIKSITKATTNPG